MNRVRLALPTVGDAELAEIAAVLASSHLTQGPAVERFEELVAAEVGVRYAIATSSGTTALHLSLAALGVGPGDDVIVPAFTFPATANVVVQLGARPVFADIDLGTFAVTAETVAAALTPATVAVMPVDPFGYPADLKAIGELARGRGVRIVEDAACALGASRDGLRCGAFPDAGCFSFHPRKVITTGEGGMITTDDGEIAETARVLRNHGGRRSGGRFVYEAAGFNHRLSDVQAAIGVAQMARLHGLLERRRELADEMDKRLAGIPGVQVVVAEEGVSPVHQSYVVLLGDGIDRDQVILDLRERGIESTLGYYGLHLEPYFRRALGTSAEALPNATAAAQRSLALPLFPEMTSEDTALVADALDEVLGAR